MMKRSKFNEQRIIAAQKDVGLGAKAGETCRKYGISEPTYHKRKGACGGMDASQLKRLKELHAENATLKKMYAELATVLLERLRRFFLPPRPDGKSGLPRYYRSVLATEETMDRRDVRPY